MIDENQTDVTKKIIKEQSGQTLIEFILLLSSIVMVAYSFMRLTNSGIEQKWTKMAQIILDDESIVIKAR